MSQTIWPPNKKIMYRHAALYIYSAHLDTDSGCDTIHTKVESLTVALRAIIDLISLLTPFQGFA